MRKLIPCISRPIYPPYLKFLIFSAIAFFVAGCTDDSSYIPLSPSSDCVEVPYEVEGHMLVSRSVPATSMETKLDKVHLLFFYTLDADDTDKAGTLAYSTSVTINPGKSQFLVIPPKLDDGTTRFQILAVGNGNSYSPSGDFDAKMAEVIAQSTNINDIITNLEASYSGAVTVTAGVLPLYGYYVDDNLEEIPFTFTRDADEKATMTSEGKFYFKRAICRLDIYNLVPGTLDIKYARAVNYRTAGCFFEEGYNVGEISPFTDIASLGETPGSFIGYREMTDEKTDDEGRLTSQEMKGQLYAFPNVVNASQTDDKVTTALMIAGYYTDPDTGERDTGLTYYRFNYASAGEPQSMHRNYCYTAVIRGVRARGASTETEAYNRKSPVLDYQIESEWDDTGDNVATDDDGNYLILAKNHVEFGGSQTFGDVETIKVTTNMTLSLEEVTNQANNKNDMFTASLSGRNVTFGPKEENNEAYVRHGYWRVVGTNPSTGKKLYVNLFVSQLSSLSDIKMLTVGGVSGEYDINLDANGGTYNFKVVTGSYRYTWKATVTEGDIAAWNSESGSVSSITTSGGNNTNFVLTVPANVSAVKRTAKVTVSLTDPDYEDENGISHTVESVVLNISQEPSADPLIVEGLPLDGIIRVNALDLTYSTPYAASDYEIAKKLYFKVTARGNRKVRVTSYFDCLRDAYIAKGSAGSSNVTNQDVIYDPEIYGGPNGLQYIDLGEGGGEFSLNVFRTGPGDADIEANIKVEAYTGSYSSTSVEHSRSFDVIITSEGAVLDDVLIDIAGGKTAFLPDRNYGLSRTDGEDFRYMYCRFSGNPTDKNFKINEANFVNSEGIAGHPVIYYESRFYPTDSIAALDDFRRKTGNNRHIYSDGKGWQLGSVMVWNGVLSHIIMSKWRYFIVSDYKKVVNGVPTNVACWLPYRTPYSIIGAGTSYTDDIYGITISREPFDASFYMSMYYAGVSPSGASGLFILNSGNTPDFKTARVNSAYGSNYSYCALCRPSCVLDPDDSRLVRYKREYLGINP